MTTADIPEEWRERIAATCFWLADNYTVWQPFALLACVGVLFLSISLLLAFWEKF
jgi:hypothetical protein